MTTTYEKGLDFEKVWATIQANNEQIRELQESQKETDRQMRESSKRLDKQLGKLGNRFGEMVIISQRHGKFQASRLSQNGGQR